MIAGHAFYYFLPDENWLRIPDRILAPVFLVSIGYNAGVKLKKIIIVGAVAITLGQYLILDSLYMNILWTIILVRWLIEPLARRLLKSKSVFWGINVAFILLYPITTMFFDYGTLAFIMAMAGWLNKNRSADTDKIIKPSEYFAFTYTAYLFLTKLIFDYTYMEIFIIAAGMAIIMYLLFNMKSLLINSIQNKPTDAIGRFCKFLGHKSLEIYIVHMLLFQAILYYALNVK